MRRDKIVQLCILQPSSTYKTLTLKPQKMAVQSIIALSCDDSYLSLLVTGEQLEDDDVLMSDSQYAEGLQFQEAIMGSIAISIRNLSEKKKIVKEIGESSQTLCEICAEKKDNNQMFSVKKCNHRYCTNCIAKLIEIKVQKRVVSSNTEIVPGFDCPGLDCKGVLEIDDCRDIIPKYVVAMWDDIICESMIDSSQKFYCPYKDCSGLIVNDGDDVIIISECPYCKRLFCAQCRVPWHSGFGCKEFLKLNENERGGEDLMVHELAKKQKWQRCPCCKYFVEKSQGYLHMTCRCGYEFCYACGAIWSSTHGSCQ